MRDLMEIYWPWSKFNETKPRGLRNLRLEELFPYKDNVNARRFVGTIDLGRHGGGKPVFNHGTKEDPILRFQFGSKDLRRYVDNNLRYKRNKHEQQEYKEHLDKLVEEKKMKEKQDRAENSHFFQQQGWSNEETLRHLETESMENKQLDAVRYNNIKSIKMMPPNKARLDPIIHTKNFSQMGKNRKLPSLSNHKEEGVDLVTILAKDRRYPLRIPLCSSDITSKKKLGATCIWNRKGSAYLKELTQQMILKQQKIKEAREKELITSQQHFTTWNQFWGRPGNGAPLTEIKKQSLDQLLYPTVPPIRVH